MLKNDWNKLDPSERIIIALDCEADKALSIAYELKGRAKWVKVGMTLYYAFGPELVKILKQSGYNVFLDLKFYDIPHQVEGAARSASLSGADMLTMHASGGADMMRAALKGIEQAQEIEKGANPLTLGITVLTSMNDEVLSDIGVSRNMEDQVLHLAKSAQASGLSGVVSSPQEAEMLRVNLGDSALIVTPGVRPAGSDVGDQSRVATPVNALKWGASYIVVGRPITGADDPAKAFDSIAESIEQELY